MRYSAQFMADHRPTDGILGFVLFSKAMAKPCTFPSVYFIATILAFHVTIESMIGADLDKHLLVHT